MLNKKETGLASTGATAISDFVEELQKQMKQVFVDMPLTSGIETSETALGIAGIPELVRHYSHCAISAASSSLLEQISAERWICATIPGVVRILTDQWKLVRTVWAMRGALEEPARDLLLSAMLLAHGGGEDAAIYAIRSDGAIHVRRPITNYRHMVELLLPSAICDALLRFWMPLTATSILPAAMAVWGQITTQHVGRCLSRIVERPFAKESEADHPKGTHSGERLNPDSVEDSGDFEKLKILVNLLKDDQADEARMSRMVPYLLATAAPGEERLRELRRKLPGYARLRVDYAAFDRYPQRGLDLIADLVGLAMEDGRLTRAETLYIREVAQSVGFDTGDMAHLLDECGRMTTLVSRHTLSRG